MNENCILKGDFMHDGGNYDREGLCMRKAV